MNDNDNGILNIFEFVSSKSEAFLLLLVFKISINKKVFKAVNFGKYNSGEKCLYYKNESID